MPEDYSRSGLADAPRNRLYPNPRLRYMRPRLTAYDKWKGELPYGLWICGDGREILFNRDYVPIWERRPEQPVRAADRLEWVYDIVKKEWFFHDGSFRNPQVARATIANLNSVLASWGLPKLSPRPHSRRQRR